MVGERFSWRLRVRPMCDRPDARDLPEVFDVVSSRDGLGLRDGDDLT